MNYEKIDLKKTKYCINSRNCQFVLFIMKMFNDSESLCYPNFKTLLYILCELNEYFYENLMFLIGSHEAILNLDSAVKIPHLFAI